MVWTCPDCDRQFARTRQGHECAPAMTLAEYFSTGPPMEKPIFAVVLAHLESLGPVHVEPVSVGVFFKQPRNFAQLRPMTRWIALSFSLNRRVDHRLISRKPLAHGGRYYHVVNLREPDDLDAEIKGWLSEAYFDEGR
ncbi:MAG TPA: DUF5655 domain-containing protein [Acidimicrobiia bacterium]|jgi:hypothetical protein|nr:DUF5655 domain-containing protein [Acidimicrobiia bacterium]